MRLRFAIAVAALSGFVALSYELVWYRVLSVMTRGTAATFGLLLAAYLFGIAIGARGSAYFCKGESGEPGQLRVLAIFVAVSNVIAALVAPSFAWSAKFTDFRLGLAVVALGAAFLGAVLPLVSHFGIEPDDRAGPRLSYVYLANIVGSAAGSLLTGFVLMDHLSVMAIGRLLVLAGFALAAIVLARAGLPRAQATKLYALFGAGALVCAVATPTLYDHLYERLVYKNEWDGTQRFRQIVETKSGVITVADDGTVYGGGGYDGVVNVALPENDKNGILRAYVLGGFHAAPREVLMVGLASGSWAQVVANLPGVERMTIVEINPGYVDVVKANPQVRSLLDNPKVTLLYDDGRRWMRRNPDRRFDLVVMNTTMHWRAHASNILSVDFLQIARRHLLPGGLLYFNTTDSYDVQRTAAETFPHLLRVTNFVLVSEGPFHFDRDRWRMVMETMTLDGRPILDRSRARDREVFENLLGFNDIEGRETVLERTKANGAVAITDDNMVVEWRDPLRYPELK